MFIEVIDPAPVLNTPDFSYVFGGENGYEIPLSPSNQPFHFEFVALKGMVFVKQEEMVFQDKVILHICWPSYPNKQLFIDSRFTMPCNRIPSDPAPPKADEILENMTAMKGSAYVWGGNWHAGIPEMLTYYPPKKKLDASTEKLWTFHGVDCSGLLFEASQGAFPRNTSQLIDLGSPVPLSAPLKPLDMIIYPGHVLFVKNATTTIESKYPLGVIEEDLATRISELEKKRVRVADTSRPIHPSSEYTIRRFIID